jgi:predicted cobalt transporter CbtA
MEQGTLGTAFSAWIVVALAIGIGLVVVSGGLALSLIGIVLIVLGLIGIMPALRFTVFRDPHR